MDSQDIYTVAEMAEYLKLNEKTILKMIQTGEIPATKVASQWRFRKDIIDAWFTSKVHSMPNSKLHNILDYGEINYPLGKILDINYIIPNLQTGDIRYILNQLIQPLKKDGLIDNEEMIIQNLVAREDMASTAISNGIAIPHFRKSTEWPFEVPKIILGLSSEGIEFGAPDRSLSKIFILLCAKSEVIHLRLLTRIALLFKDSQVFNTILSFKKSEQILAYIIQKENEILFQNK